MKVRKKIMLINFTLFIVITFYNLGAGFVESLVNYPVWHIIGPSEIFTAYHIALSATIIPVLAVPALLLSFITNILLLFFRPMVIPKWTVRLALMLLLVVIVSSAFVQIPIQMQLHSGYSKELVDRLITTDLLFRVLVGVIRCMLIMYMMYQAGKGLQPAQKLNAGIRRQQATVSAHAGQY